MAGLQVDGLAASYPSGHVIAPHEHAAGQLIYARAGVMRVVTAPGTWIVPPHRAVWVAPQVMHAIHCATDVDLRTLYLSPASAVRLHGPCATLAVSALLREAILRLVEGPAEGALRPLLIDLIRAELAEIAVAPLHLPEPRDPRLRRLVSALRADPATRRSLPDWATALGMGRRTLMRRFRGETGMSISQWHRQLRLHHALEELAQGRPVTTVAIDLGYDSVSAFIAAFRRVLGVTPGQAFADRDGGRQPAADGARPDQRRRGRRGQST